MQWLIWQKLIYQDALHANAIFVSADRTCCEIRGTCPDKPFHGIQFAEPTAYWSFTAPESDLTVPPTAYICEAAIDAISLYALMKSADIVPEHAVYCSVAGVSNQRRIDRIKRVIRDKNGTVVLAVDNDSVGESCRQRNADCEVWIPCKKDWNEDLLAMRVELPP